MIFFIDLFLSSKATVLSLCLLNFLISLLNLIAYKFCDSIIMSISGLFNFSLALYCLSKYLILCNYNNENRMAEVEGGDNGNDGEKWNGARNHSNKIQFKRIGVLFDFINASIVCSLSCTILIKSLAFILKVQHIKHTVLMTTVGSITLVFNFIMFCFDLIGAYIKNKFSFKSELNRYKENVLKVKEDLTKRVVGHHGRQNSTTSTVSSIDTLSSMKSNKLTFETKSLRQLFNKRIVECLIPTDLVYKKRKCVYYLILFCGSASTIMCSELKNNLLELIQKQSLLLNETRRAFNLTTNEEEEESSSMLDDRYDIKYKTLLSDDQIKLLDLFEYRLILTLPTILSIFISLIYLYYYCYILRKSYRILSEAVPTYISVDTLASDLLSLDRCILKIDNINTYELTPFKCNIIVSYSLREQNHRKIIDINKKLNAYFATQSYSSFINRLILEPCLI